MAISVKKGGSSSRPVTLPMVVSIRFDEQTTAKLTLIAHERGINVSDVVRSMVQVRINHPSPVPLERRHVPHGDLLAAILAELGKIGSNLNQCAHIANATKILDLERFDVCRDDLKTITRAVRAVSGGTIDP